MRAGRDPYDYSFRDNNNTDISYRNGSNYEQDVFNKRSRSWRKAEEEIANGATLRMPIKKESYCY